MRDRKGFTFVEVLVYAGTLAITAGILTAVLNNVVTVRTKEANSTELSQQLGFVNDTIRTLVGEASLIEAVYEGSATSTACSQFCTVKLRMSATSTDPTYITSDSAGIYLSQGGNATTTLTGVGTAIDQFILTKYEFSGGHASLGIDIALTINPSNPKFAVTRKIQSAIGRATAATFDSDLVPSGNWNVGQSGLPWVNGYFSGNLVVDTNTLYVDAANNRVGVGVASPQTLFHMEDLVSSHIALTLENADAVAGMELETQTATAADEAIFNIGIMTERGIPLKSATNPDAAWFRIDTRAGAEKGFRWYWEAASTSTETAVMTLASTGQLGLLETTAPSATASYGKLYVSSADSLLHFVDDGGTGHALLEDVKCLWIANPTAADDLKSIWIANGFAATLTKIWCESDQTVVANLQVDDGTPAGVNGADLTCNTTAGGVEDETLEGDPTMADGERLDLAITSVSGTPTWFSMCWSLVYNE